MTGTLVDTNVLVDILFEDAEWSRWSSGAMLLASTSGRLFVNPIIFAEVAGGFDDAERFHAAMAIPDIERADLPWEAAFLASRAFREYRRRGGTHGSLLPDLYIGAHAAVSDLAILTRDPRRFISYFPTVTVISPSDS